MNMIDNDKLDPQNEIHDMAKVSPQELTNDSDSFTSDNLTLLPSGE